MKCVFFNSRQKLIFCHKLKKIQENKKIGIHIFVSDGPSASASCYEALGPLYKCVICGAWSTAQVRDPRFLAGILVKKVLCLFSYSASFIISHIVILLGINTRTRQQKQRLETEILICCLWKIHWRSEVCIKKYTVV